MTKNNNQLIQMHVKALLLGLQKASSEEREALLLPLMHKGNITEDQVLQILEHLAKETE